MRWTSCGLLLAMTACATPSPSPPTSAACAEVGTASWYRGRSAGGDLVAAHKTLPFGTSVQVTSLDTGRSVLVRINDRGPFRAGRIIDLSTAAAEKLGMKRDGVSQVRLEMDGATGDACPFRDTKLTSS